MELSLEALSGGKDAVIKTTLEHPATKGGDVGQAMKAAVKAVEDNIVACTSPAVQAVLQDCYDTHCLMYGDPDDLTDSTADEWHEALDGAVDEALQPWSVAVSAAWLADKTIETKLNDEGRIEILAQQTGLEIYKQLREGMTDNQVLSAVGVVKADVEAALSAAGPTDMESVGQQCQAIFMRMVEGLELIGMPDDTTLREEIDLVSGSDAILAGSAMSRLGLEPADVAVLQGARSALRLGAIDALFQMCKWCIEPPVAGEMPPIPDEFKIDPGDAPKPKGKGKGKAKAAPAAPGDDVECPVEALRLLKEHANVTDKDMAEKLGISRPAFNNAAQGKGKKPIAGAGQLAIIRQELMTHANGLIEAINLIDAATPSE